MRPPAKAHEGSTPFLAGSADPRIRLPPGRAPRVGVGQGSPAVWATVARTERASFSFLIGWAGRWGRMLRTRGSLGSGAREVTLRLADTGSRRCVRSA